MLTRRGFVALGTAVGAAAVPAALRLTADPARAGEGATVAPGLDHAHLHQAGAAEAVPAVAAEPFSAPLPIPATLRPTRSTWTTDYYDVEMAPAATELVPGLPTEVLAYNGSYVGPTIRALRGRTVVVRHRNGLDMPAAVHLHGGHVPAVSDGYPMDVIAPGESRTYTYPNHQRGATLWYHDHAHHMESEHVYRGLHGFYLLEDLAERLLRLPSGAYDVPIMLTDANIAADGTLVYVDNDFRGRTTVLANGIQQPYLRVAARKYRLRLLDASNLRFFTLSLSLTGAAGPTEEVAQIASDGGLLPAPVRLTSIPLSPGERAEIVVDFARYPVGSQLFLMDGTRQVMRFDVVQSARRDDSRLPQQLSSLPPLPPAATTRDVALGLNLTAGFFAINGQAFDPNRVDATVKRGTSEIWTVTNTDTQYGVPHNLHIHLVQFRILDRNGVPPVAAEAGLKDTVAIPVGESVRIQATFADYLGRYVYHCHMLDHSALGMMAQLEVVP